MQSSRTPKGPRTPVWEPLLYGMCSHAYIARAIFLFVITSATTDYLSILSFLSMLFCFFSSRFNSFYDIITLPGTINTIFCFQRSFHDFKKLQHFYKISSVKNSFVTLFFQPIFKLFLKKNKGYFKAISIIYDMYIYYLFLC